MILNVSNPHHIRKLVLELANADTVTKSFLENTITLKRGGHDLATYEQGQLTYLYTELEALECPTFHQIVLLKKLENEKEIIT